MLVLGRTGAGGEGGEEGGRDEKEEGGRRLPLTATLSTKCCYLSHPGLVSQTLHGAWKTPVLESTSSGPHFTFHSLLVHRGPFASRWQFARSAMVSWSGMVNSGGAGGFGPAAVSTVQDLATDGGGRGKGDKVVVEGVEKGRRLAAAAWSSRWRNDIALGRNVVCFHRRCGGCHGDWRNCSCGLVYDSGVIHLARESWVNNTASSPFCDF